MNEITLTEEQQLRILEEWNSRPNNPPSLLELIQVAFPDEKVDGRSKEGKAVKQFLATRKIDARRSHEYKAKDKIELNEEQQEFVVNNAATMSANEMARVLFKNPELMPLSQETRTINDFIKQHEGNSESLKRIRVSFNQLIEFDRIKTHYGSGYSWQPRGMI